MARKVHTKELDDLFACILQLENLEECYQFFEDLCTVKELQSLGQRLEVARMLRNNLKYMEVVNKTGASTATISRVNRCLNYGTDGYELVISRLEQKEKNRDITITKGTGSQKEGDEDDT